jgi:glucose-6-phosphate isomerase
MATIDQSETWSKLKAHVGDIQQTHLRDLLKDSKRTENLILTHNGIYVDFSRQNATNETVKVG